MPIRLSLSVNRSAGAARAYALAADENGRFQEAAAGYEACLASDPADLQTIVNLLVLYWQAADEGVSVLAPISAEFRAHAAGRLIELLKSATDRFPDSAELRFWIKYIATARIGRPLELAEYRDLLRRYPYYLEPAFVVFSDSAGVEAEAEAMRLLADYSEQPTARGRYVTSVISSTLRKQRFFQH
jgi:tetratricopeptide (TPR) repeat protein